MMDPENISDDISDHYFSGIKWENDKAHYYCGGACGEGGGDLGGGEATVQGDQ